MSIKTILYTSTLLILVSACGGKQSAKEQQNSLSQVVTPQEHRMDIFDYTDSVMMGSHKIVYSLHREADESLQIVEDENGERYVDNYYDVNVVKDGISLFSYHFIKASFNSYLEKGFVTNGILDGFRFIAAREGMVTFGACISYPDSDMSAPFIVTIGPDGSYTIQPDSVLDIEEETDSASI